MVSRAYRPANTRSVRTGCVPMACVLGFLMERETRMRQDKGLVAGADPSL